MESFTKNIIAALSQKQDLSETFRIQLESSVNELIHHELSSTCLITEITLILVILEIFSNITLSKLDVALTVLKDDQRIFKKKDTPNQYFDLLILRKDVSI